MMMPKTFIKPARSIPDQLQLLESRGLVIADRALAEHCLQHISYYRLRAYWYYFEIDAAKADHQLQPGTTFQQVLDLYNFDRELRLLINDGIERIEVAARGTWAHSLAMGYGPHGYLKPNLYRNPNQHRNNLAQLDAELARSHDGFIAHYNTAYGDPPQPPVWMVAEVISFGLLSKMISALATRGDRNTIARSFGLDEKILTSFLHHLATARNVCAHHGRLWNRRLTVTPTLPAAPRELADSVNHLADRRIYNTLTMMIFIMRQIAPQADWSLKLVELLRENPTQDFSAMGFPLDWHDTPVWAAAMPT